MEEVHKILPVEDEIWELRVKDTPNGKDEWYQSVRILGQAGDQNTFGQPLNQDGGVGRGVPIMVTYETSKFIAAYQKQAKSPTATVKPSCSSYQ